MFFGGGKIVESATHVGRKCAACGADAIFDAAQRKKYLVKYPIAAWCMCGKEKQRAQDKPVCFLGFVLRRFADFMVSRFCLRDNANKDAGALRTKRKIRIFIIEKIGFVE